MSAPVLRGAFAEHLAPLNAESWQAWKLGERESDPVALQSPIGLDDAVTQAMARLCFHPKDTLAVLYTHTGRGKRTLWLYTIKRSTRRGFWREATDGGRKVFVPQLEPSLICETPMAQFAPVERFDAFRDDPVGIDRQLVEQR